MQVVEVVEQEIIIEDEASLLDAISVITVENRKLDDIIGNPVSEFSNQLLLRIHLEGLVTENHLKKLLFLSSSGDLEVYDKYVNEMKEFMESLSKIVKDFRQNCLNVKKLRQG